MGRTVYGLIAHTAKRLLWGETSIKVYWRFAPRPWGVYG